MPRIHRPLFACALIAAPLCSQTWTEGAAGEDWRKAEVTVGNGALAHIDGTLDAAEGADMFVVYVNDPATFTCSSVGGATWDTQLFMFDMQGNGISFKDDDTGTLRSTMTGQFLTGPGPVIVAISRYDDDPQDDAAQALWLDTPYTSERQPDGPGAANPVDSWDGTAGATDTYTLTLTGASFALADDPDDALVAWAWVNVFGTAAEFTPSIIYQHTPSGETITVDRVSQGEFIVYLGAMPFAGVAHATAYGTNNGAVIDYWNNSFGELGVKVNVLDSSGALVDAPFCVHFRAGGASDDRAAYLWANQPTAAAPYTPSSTYSFNGNRSAPQITRTGTGAYSVLLPGLSTIGQAEGGNVQVSAYGGTSLIRAKVTGWGSSGSDLNVGVRTFDAGGNPSDEYFTLSYHEVAAPIPGQVGSGAHAWASQPTNPSPYTPSPLYFDSNGNAGPSGGETITRTSTGVYEVELPDLAPFGSSIAMATAYGSSADYASIGIWTTGTTTGTTVQVRTYDSTGAAADSNFTLLYLTDDPAGTPAVSAPFGAGCEGLGLTADTRPVLDGSWDLRGHDVPPPAIFTLMFVGLSNPNLPGVAFGAPGCTLYQDLIVSALVPVAAPTYSIPVPNNAALVGYTLYAQLGAVVPGINPLGIVASNGMVGVVGDV